MANIHKHQYSLPVFLCVNMFVLSLDSYLMLQSFPETAKKKRKKMNAVFFNVLLQDFSLKQIANEADCCDKQMDMVPFALSSQPTNPTPQISGLIKCSFLSRAASSHLFCCCNQSTVM